MDDMFSACSKHKHSQKSNSTEADVPGTKKLITDTCCGYRLLRSPHIAHTHTHKLNVWSSKSICAGQNRSYRGGITPVLNPVKPPVPMMIRKFMSVKILICPKPLPYVTKN